MVSSKTLKQSTDLFGQMSAKERKSYGSASDDGKTKIKRCHCQSPSRSICSHMAKKSHVAFAHKTNPMPMTANHRVTYVEACMMILLSEHLCACTMWIRPDDRSCGGAVHQEWPSMMSETRTTITDNTSVKDTARCPYPWSARVYDPAQRHDIDTAKNVMDPRFIEPSSQTSRQRYAVAPTWTPVGTTRRFWMPPAHTRYRDDRPEH